MSVILDRQRANIVDSNTSKSVSPCNFNCYVLTCCVNINAAAVYRLREIHHHLYSTLHSLRLSKYMYHAY